MATHTFVHFEHGEAAALARLQSIHFDLWSAIQLCEYFESQSQNGYPPSEITDAFSTAILVRYSRAFVSGVRKGLGEDALAPLSVEQRANHERLRAYRDKHIAHSVNAFEDTKVQARYCEERVQQEGITGFGRSLPGHGPQLTGCRRCHGAVQGVACLRRRKDGRRKEEVTLRSPFNAYR